VVSRKVPQLPSSMRAIIGFVLLNVIASRASYRSAHSLLGAEPICHSL